MNSITVDCKVGLPHLIFCFSGDVGSSGSFFGVTLRLINGNLKGMSLFVFSVEITNLF